MASIQKRSGAWRAVIRRKGHPTQIKTWPTKVLAEAWARKVEREMDTAEFVDRRSYRGTSRDLLTRYRDEVSPGKKGARSEIVRLNLIMREGWTAKPVNDVQKMDIIRWRDGRACTGPTVRREMVLLNAVFSHAKREWTLPIVNPLQGVSMPANSVARERRPSITELGAIRSHLREKKMGLLMELAIETAMRLGEMCSLTWADVHLSERYVLLRDTKNGTARRVPLSTKAVETFEKLTPGTGRVFHFSSAAASVYWRNTMKTLGIKDLHFHDLRHEATTRMADKLVNVLELAAVTGHKDLRTLQRYYNPHATDLARKLG